MARTLGWGGVGEQLHRQLQRGGCRRQVDWILLVENFLGLERLKSQKRHCVTRVVAFGEPRTLSVGLATWASPSEQQPMLVDTESSMVTALERCVSKMTFRDPSEEFGGW